MPNQILMPALSPTMEEGALSKWLVKEGDRVNAGDVIAEIETDKATMEVEAVDEGVIEKLLVPAGTQGVKVNAPIALLAGEGESPAAKPASGGEAAPEPSPVSAPKTEPQPTAKAERQTPPQQAVLNGERVMASPLARRLAERAGLRLEDIEGSGPHGRIVQSDVEAAQKGGARKAQPPTEAPAEPKETPPAQQSGEIVPLRAEAAKPPALPFPAGSYETVPLDGMRRAIARRMSQAARDVPHFPLTIDVEIDRLLAVRKELNARLERDGVKLSVNDLLIRACALTLKRLPEANVSYVNDTLLKHKHAHIAVAVAIPGGLITPVIFHADSKGLADISHEMKALADKARNRKLMPQEYEGGTFSISNLGMMGISSFTSILNEPQAMILSVGAGEQRPIVRNGALAVATMMTLTLTCDHRAVDGATGAEFLAQLRRFIEDPMTMML